MDNTKFKIYDRILGECDDAVRLCTDNKTKNDIWDKTMTEVTIVGIPHDFFYAIQRELKDVSII
jgi:hypothetical protein